MIASESGKVKNGKAGAKIAVVFGFWPLDSFPGFL